ncbi:Toll/interleukin-1 receptor domain-containing protein [Tanacetum coccineum]|uniref:Toll/interleukin-1 receptor domain-containing protein n=1 Tax=Tanacetum coccineum TaxID=301880 RepID=A0ABQ5CAK6_9ASTR
MDNSKRGHIPMQERLDLNKTQGASTPKEVKRMQNVPYASAVGSIMYVVRCTRPDVAFAQNITSRFQQNPGELHWTAVKNILKYLRNTKDMFLVYGGNPEAELRVDCYCNAGFETDRDEIKSLTGYLNNIAASEAEMGAVWIRKFISRLGIVSTINKPIKMFCDNSVALLIANELGVQMGARHYHRSNLLKVHTGGATFIAKSSVTFLAKRSKIPTEVSLELRFISSDVDRKLIGMKTRINDVVSRLETSADDVRMIWIKGMGVLSDIFKGQDITVSRVSNGKNMMKKMMYARKVLVVLDDIVHIDQLEALAGYSNWFKPGSRIIITTRDEQVLVAHKVKLIHVVDLLSDKEAICLFSSYAFGKEIQIQGYKELSEQVVCYARGLPLTIKVLGSFLCGKNNSLKETLEKLELSYNSLEDDYKEIFLDVACVLKWWNKDEAIIVLECCGFHARNGLRVLEQKSLITISEYGELGMHDHIEEMGKNIVCRLHPNKTNKHSRLWIDEEIKYILANDLGTEDTTKGIVGGVVLCVVGVSVSVSVISGSLVAVVERAGL